MKNKKSNISKFIGAVILIILIIIISIILLNKPANKVMADLNNMTVNEIKNYAKENSLKLSIEYEYNKKILLKIHFQKKLPRTL